MSLKTFYFNNLFENYKRKIATYYATVYGLPLLIIFSFKADIKRRVGLLNDFY
jgi:hypothetical protein